MYAGRRNSNPPTAEAVEAPLGPRAMAVIGASVDGTIIRPDCRPAATASPPRVTLTRPTPRTSSWHRRKQAIWSPTTSNTQVLSGAACGIVVPPEKERHVLRRPAVPPSGQMSTRMLHHRRGRRIASVVVIVAVLCTGVSLAPSALADPADNFRDAVASLRGAASCGPLVYHPVVEQAAEIVNRSTDAYLDQAARVVPIGDPLPVLKDLGYGGNKAKLLSGASRNDDADAIKGVIIQGYAAIPDCTYTDFGVNVKRNETSGYFLTSLVLAGP
jgi:hypothetical protein